ncbi:MAG: energy-coupling factor transporter transmembrane component T [Nitrospiraceae bacterium]|nr:energy-coupling factor transporter transmembrane component T [Nitrospiraceae bacterium]
MIDVSRVDYWAANGASPLHRASAWSKLLFVAFIVASAVLARQPLPLAAGIALLLALAAANRLPLTAVGMLSLYAAVFAGLYAASLRGGIAVTAVVLLKAVMPAFAVGMLIVTTPYPRIFAFLSSFLPEILAAGLFMTYRTFFILLDMMHHFGTAIRLRGGFSPGSIIKNAGNISKGIGALLVRAVERSTRLYAVMSARGYSGSMAEPTMGGVNPFDVPPIAAGLFVLMLVALWR